MVPAPGRARFIPHPTPGPPRPFQELRGRGRLLGECGVRKNGVCDRESQTKGSPNRRGAQAQGTLMTAKGGAYEANNTPDLR